MAQKMTMSARNLFAGSPRVVSPHLRKTDRDQYGQEHPIETPELISSSLSLLVVELADIRRSERQYLVEAEEKYPELAKSDEHRILFLRCEMFNVDVSIVTCSLLVMKESNGRSQG
eukprot:scaffold161126_cov46-Attheya_sp.AAC.1